MNSATSNTKPILRHKISNGFVLFTAIWSSAVMPVMPSYAKMLTPDELPTLGSDPVLTDDGKTEKFIAEYSQSAARFISDKKKVADLADMAQDFARSKVTNAATDEINQWLSKAGNAKFSVNVDKKLSIKNTQLDWLVPWYDSTDLLLFSQHNIHRTDGRLQTNNGVGVRRFTPESMMGVNAFFDHDLSRYHSRLGFGAEYAQDFLKLSANTYLRTSAWRGAPELNNDYNARPANGWDLQAEGWLPSYPNIGGNLKFEQYFGDDVALFGKDKRQKDPLATTVGVNWTPFSLMTLSAEHKISGGLSETNAKVQFTWALGKSLAEQLDPTKVGDARRLLGSRYDFVNRNNNIVLEYQKKTLISLSLPTIVQGKTGETLPLINALNTKYPLDKLTVQAPEFLTAGGEIILDGAATKIKLPSYKVAMTEQERKKINLYRFTVTASDSKGNISPQATTLVEVTDSGVLSINPSEVIKQGNTVANGLDINTLTVTARDTLGNVSPDSTVTFTLPAELKLVTQKATSSKMAFSNLFKKMQAAKSATQNKYQVVTNIKGEASIQFTSLVTGEHRVQAVANGGVPIESTFSFIADTHQAHINQFNILNDNAVADGKSKNKIQFYITDNNAHPIQGAMLQLNAKNARVTQLAPTDEQGNTEVEVDSQVAGPVEITATLNEQSVAVKVYFVFGQLAHVDILELSKAEAGADSNITISLTDIHGNAVSGVDGTVTVNIDGKPTPIAITETFPGSGVYTGKLPGQHTGTPNITVTIDGQTSSPETLIVEQPKTISPTNPNGTGQKGEKGVIDSLAVTPSHTHGLQSGDSLDLTVTITDAFGNGLSGLDTNNLNIGNLQGNTLGWVDNGDGSYTTILPLTEVGNNDLTASINGTTSPKTDVHVNNATGTIHVENVNIIKTEKPAAGVDSTMTLELTDKHGNPVTGETEITINIDDQPHTLPVTETSPGIYDVIISGQHTGNHDISVTVNGEESAKELLIVDKPLPVKPKDPSGAGHKGEQGVVDKIDIKTGNTVGLQSGDNIELTVTITDAFGNGLAGLNTDNINIGKHKGDSLTWTDNGNGSYTTTLPLTEVGNNDLTVSINNNTSTQKHIQVGNAAGKDKVSKVEITKLDPAEAGKGSILEVALTDKNNNPVIGETSITIDIDGNKHLLPAKETKPGIYEVTLPGLQSGKLDIIASVDGKVSNKNQLFVESPKPISPIDSTGTGQKGGKGVIDKVAITVDQAKPFQSGNTLDVTVTIADAFGNGLVGLNTDNIDIGKHKGSSLNWVDNGNGSYTTTLTLTETGANDITASINGTKSPLTEVQVDNATNSTKVANIIFDSIPASEAGETQMMTLKITDANHHPVTQIANDIQVTIEGQKKYLQLAESSQDQGTYTVLLPGQQAGSYTIIAQVNQKTESRIWLVRAANTINAKPLGNSGERGVLESIEFQTSPRDNLKVGDTLTLTAIMKDAFGNTLKGMDTALIYSPYGRNGNAPWKDNLDGTYQSDITLVTLGKNKLAIGFNQKIKSNDIIINVANSEQVAHVTKIELDSIPDTNAGNEQTITIKAYGSDVRKYGITNIANAITVTLNGNIVPITLTESMQDKGTYTGMLPAQLKGKYKIAAKVNQLESTAEWRVNLPTTLTNIPNGQAGERGVINSLELKTSPITMLKSGDTLHLTVTAKDAFGNTLKGIDGKNITLTHNQNTKVTWIDKKNGSYTADLLLTQLASDTVAVNINGQSQAVRIDVGHATESAKITNVLLDPIHASEAGEDQTITVKVTDKYQHPVTAIAGEISVTLNTQPQAIRFRELPAQKGSYTATLLAKKTGDYNVKVSANSQVASKVWQVKKPAIIAANEKSGGGVGNQRGVVKTVELTSSLTKNLKSGDSLQLAVTLKDAFDNYLEGIDTTYIQLPNKQAKTINWSDNRNGNYTAILPLTSIGKDSLIATVNNQPSSQLDIKVGNATGATLIHKVVIQKIPNLEAGNTATITLNLTDANGLPIIGVNNNAIISINGTETLFKITEKTKNSGIYSGTLLGLREGTYKVIVTVGGTQSVMSMVNVNPPTTIANVLNSTAGERGVVNSATLSITPNTGLKSGNAVTLTATLKDAFDNTLSGVDVKNITLTHNQTGNVTWVAGKDGTYTTELKLTKLGEDRLFITVNTAQSKTVPINVTKQSGSTAIHKVDITDITNTTAGAKSIFTVVLTDAQGNLVEGIQNVDVTIGKQKLTNIALTPKADGSYTGELPGQQTGSHDVVITANNQPSTKETLTVAQPDTFTASANGGGTKGQRGVVSSVKLSTTQNSKLTSGDSLQLTVELKDSFNNPLRGVTSDSIALQHNQKKATVTWVGHNNGRYTTTLLLNQLGKNELKATVNNEESNMVNIDVAHSQQTAQVHQLTLEPIAPTAAGSEQTINLKALDIHGHGVVLLKDEIKITLNGALLLLTLAEDSKIKGTYTAKLPAQKTGSYNVKVAIGQKTATQPWEVKAPTAIKADKADGSGTEGHAGVVKTVELQAQPTQGYKSGETVKLTLTLKDAFDNTLSGIDVKNITLTHNQTGNVTWVAGKDGTYTTDLVLKTLGKNSLVATVNKMASQPVPINVTKQSGSTAIHKVDITDITNTTAGAKSIFTVVLTDAQGNLVEGIQNVDVTIDKQKLPNTLVTQQADGSYTGELPGQQTGSHDVVITANNQPSTKETLTVAQPDTFTASANGGGTKGQRGVVSSVKLSTTQNSKLTSGDSLQLTVELKDSFNNPLRGVTSDNIALQHNQKKATVTWVGHNNGRYTTTLLLNQLGKNELKATVNNEESNMVNIDVAHSQQTAQVHQLTLEPIAPTAAGSEQTITLKAVNIYGHGVTELKDEIKIILSGALLLLKLTEDSKIKGTYTAKLPAQKTGSYNVKVAIGQKTATQPWEVKAPTAIKADKADGSGTEGHAGVVKTVELQAVAAQGYKSGEIVKLTLTLKDAFDNTLSGVDVKNITLTHNQTGNVTWVAGKDGTYTADLVLKALGKDSLVATVNKLKSLPVDITVLNTEGVNKVNKIEIIDVLLVAAGSDSTVAFSLTDLNGHPVSNITSLSVTVDQQQPISMQISQVSTGRYVGTLPGQQSGPHSMVASIPTQSVTSIKKPFDVSKPTSIEAAASNGSGTKGKYKVVSDVQFDVAPTANLKTGDKITLTVTLKDAFGNGLKGITSSSITTTHKQSGTVIWADNADGTYTSTLLLKKLGADTLKVAINGIPQSQTIDVKAPQGKLVVNKVALKATNKALAVGDTVELQLTLTDNYGNGVEKVKTDEIQLEHNNTLVPQLTWTEQSAGVYTATYPLHQQGKNTFVSRVNNQTNTPLVIDVSALSGAANVAAVELKTDTNQLTVGSKTELTLTVADQWNNGVEGITAQDITINDAHTKKNLTGLNWTAQGSGIYTAPITLSLAGIHSLKATVKQEQSKSVLIEVKPSTDPSRAHKVTLTATPNVITAGDNVTLSLKVTDVDNNPVIRLNNNDISYTGIPSKGPIIWKEDNHSLGIYTTTTMLSEVKTHTLSASIGKFTDKTNVAVNSPMGKDAVQHIKISPITESDAGKSAWLSINLTDGYKNPVKNVSSGDITTKINDKEQNIVFTEKNAMNRYMAQIPASIASRYKITVEVNGQSETVEWNVKAPTEIPIASYDKDGLRGSLETLSITHSATKNTVNSAETVTLTVGLKDKFGNKLTGASSKLKLLTNLQSTSIWQELSGGLYTQELTMNKLHKQPIQVVADKILSDKLELTVIPAKGASNVYKTTLETNEGTIEAGKEVTLTLALTDSVDNGVIDINTKDIQLTNNGKPTNVKWTNTLSGVYTTKQRLETIGNYQFKAMVNKKPSRIQTVEATYPSGKDVVKTAILTTKAATLNAGEKVELTLELKDQYNNLITGVNGADIVLTDNHTSETIDSNSIAWHMDSVGVYKATLPLTKVGKHTLTATVNKQNADTKEITVKALRGASNVKEVKLTTSVASMNAGESTTLTLTMLDNYGNEVADVAPNDMKLENSDSTIVTKASWVKISSHDGVYTANITLEKVKQHTLSVDVNGQINKIKIDVKPLEGARSVSSINIKPSQQADNKGIYTTTPTPNLILTFALTDQYGNGVIDVKKTDISLVDSQKPNAVLITSWQQSTKHKGEYTAEVSLTTAAQHDLTATVNSLPATIQVSVTPFADVKNIATTELIFDENTLSLGEELGFTLKIKDIYDNDVFVDTTEIKLFDVNNATSISQVKWDIQKDTFTRKYNGTLSFKKMGQYTISASAGKIHSKPKVLTVEAGAPVFTAGKSELSADSYQTDSVKNKSTTIRLTLKDSNGNLIFGKKPILLSNYWNQPQEMKEGTAGTYTASFNNNDSVGVAKIILENNSINYTGSQQTIQIINYGETKVRRIAPEKDHSLTEQFPHTGFAGAQFKMIPSIGEASDYDWKVNQNWLSIDDNGVVTMGKEPQKSTEALIVQITGTPKSNLLYSKKIEYQFSLNTWFELTNEIFSPFQLFSGLNCPGSKRAAWISDIHTNNNSLVKEWTVDSVINNMNIVNDTVWVYENGASLFNIKAGQITYVNNAAKILCVREY
ncbi:TPA: invasin domain 3-containing protein [Providencia rettgeri]